MNLKRENIIFILQICPLLVYGTISITSSGTQFIKQRLVLTCTISPFNSSASWVQDGNVRTTCASSFCTFYTYGSYTTFTFGSDHIKVTFDPVDSSIDGLWECTHLTLGSASFTVSATNETITTSTTPAPSTTPGDTNGSPDDKGDGKDLGIGLCTGIVVITYIIVIVLVAKRLSIKSTEETSGNCFLTFYQFIEEQFFDCCGNKNNQENPIEECLSPTTTTHVVIEGDPDFFADKVLTLNSLLGFVYLVVYGLFVGAIILFAVYYGYSNFQEGLVVGVGLAILFVLSCLCLVVVWILMKFVTNDQKDPDHRDHKDASETFRSQSCIRNGTVTPYETRKSQKKSTFDIRQQPDGDEGPQSTPKDPDARHLTTGRPLPRRPDIASPQTGTFDSVNSPIVLAPIENPNILPSIDTLDEQKTDKKPKDKKKKKKMKDEEQDNPAYVQDN